MKNLISKINNEVFRKYSGIRELTTNRSNYNKAHKELSTKCSFCKWNRGCNKHKRYYGKFILDEFNNNTTIKLLTNPSWKLTSKNEKQWTSKELNLLPRVTKSSRRMTEFLI